MQIPNEIFFSRRLTSTSFDTTKRLITKIDFLALLAKNFQPMKTMKYVREIDSSSKYAKFSILFLLFHFLK